MSDGDRKILDGSVDGITKWVGNQRDIAEYDSRHTPLGPVIRSVGKWVLDQERKRGFRLELYRTVDAI